MINEKVPLVSVIIVSHDRRKDVIDCLDAVRDQDYTNIETIVVDNRSTDGTVEAVQQLNRNIHIVNSPDDLGPAAAFNMGMRIAKGQFFLLLNDDVILSPTAITELVRVMEQDSSIGMAGSLIYYYSFPSKLWMYPAKFLKEKQKRDFLDVITIIGCSIMVSRELINSIGYFETDYFLYHEEVDFSMRARNHGFRVIVALQSSVFHKTPLKNYRAATRKHAATTIYYTNRNNFIFAKKNFRTNSAILKYLFRTFLFYPEFTTGNPEFRNFPWLNFVEALAILDFSYIASYFRGIMAGLAWFVGNKHKV